MSRQIVYKGLGLAKGSAALELWEDWQKEKDQKKRNDIQKKLDMHMKDVENRHRDLLERYK